MTGLVEDLGIPKAMASYHLGMLYQSGRWKNQKMCCEVYYWADNEVFGELLRMLKMTAESYVS